MFVFIAPPSKTAGPSGKRRRTVTLSTVAYSQTFQEESSGGEETSGRIGAYTSQQAALFGEAVASGLEIAQWSLSLLVRLISLYPLACNCRIGSIEGVIVVDYLGMGLGWESDLSYL